MNTEELRHEAKYRREQRMRGVDKTLTVVTFILLLLTTIFTW